MQSSKTCQDRLKPALPWRCTCTEVFVDETFDFLKLLEIRGLQEREQVTHVKLFPGHGGGGGGVKCVAKVEGRGFQASLSLPALPPTHSPGTTANTDTMICFLFSNTTSDI